jgi:NAD+ kinase
MKIAIYGRPTDNNTSEFIQKLLKKLNEKGIELVFYKPFYEYLSSQFPLPNTVKTFTSTTDFDTDTDCLLSIGGDGTFLSTLDIIRNTEVPVLGINTGRLGFLANVAKTEIDEAIESLVNKEYSIEKRTLLKVDSTSPEFGKANYGLNELTISKKDDHAMLTIHTYINDEYLNSYFSDGLIIATPTGSTAYSLSCGGPMVMPGSHNFVITPIAPHNLSVRPLVISDDKTIKIKVESRSSRYKASIDSTTNIIDTSVELTLQKAAFHLNVIVLENQNFFNTIRKKLHWGQDSRT